MDGSSDPFETEDSPPPFSFSFTRFPSRRHPTSFYGSWHYYSCQIKKKHVPVAIALYWCRCCLCEGVCRCGIGCGGGGTYHFLPSLGIIKTEKQHPNDETHENNGEDIEPIHRPSRIFRAEDPLLLQDPRYGHVFLPNHCNVQTIFSGTNFSQFVGHLICLSLYR